MVNNGSIDAVKATMEESRKKAERLVDVNTIQLCHIVQIDSLRLLWSCFWLLHIVLCRTIQTEPFFLLRFSLCTSFLWLCHTFLLSIRHMWCLSLMQCYKIKNYSIFAKYWFSCCVESGTFAQNLS